MTPAFQDFEKNLETAGETAARCPLPPSPRRPQFPEGAPTDLFGGHCGTRNSAKRDSETYEITGLDIGCKRAMFQKFEMIYPYAPCGLRCNWVCIAEKPFA
jgi:hypothetical protein